MKMFSKEGGSCGDIDKLKMHVSPLGGVLEGIEKKILPGYEDSIGADVGDITSELLADTLQLTHPDRHPPERKELAQRVTQDLLALKPFVFPAPKQEFVPQPLPRDDSAKSAAADLKKPLRIYPCELCADQMPYYYCDSCKAERDKRRNAERERDRAKQRKWYAQRKSRRAFRKPLCAACGAAFEGKRKDARFCSRKKHIATSESVLTSHGPGKNPPIPPRL